MFVLLHSIHFVNIIKEENVSVNNNVRKEVLFNIVTIVALITP